MKWLKTTKYRLVDHFRKTNAIGILEKIKESQWWSEKELDELQLENLKSLLIHCRNNVPYYTKLFDEIKFNPESMTSQEDISVIPVLTKDIIRNNYSLFKARNFDSFIPRPKTTGGSTGQPITVYNDFISHSYFAANNLRGWGFATDYEVGDRFITVAHGSLLPNNKTFKNKLYFYFQNSELITSYHLNDDRLKSALKRINRSHAIFIYGYSSSIYMIARFAKAHNIAVRSKLQAIYTTSDMLYKNQRELIEEVFGVQVFDSYGCPESGLISYECQHHNGYHINEESAYVEIINKDSTGLGKILSTPLYNFAFPLIRYDTGDVGRKSEGTCKCGRSLSKISELGGRIRDFVILKDGRYIHGAFFNHFKPFYTSDWIGEYQIIQEDYDKLLIKISTRRIPSEEEKQLIIEELKRGLLDDLKIEFDLGGVEYTSGGKFRLIVSNVKTQWEK